MSRDNNNQKYLDEDLRFSTISEVNPVVIADESCIYPQTRSLITPSSVADGCYIRLPQTLHRIDQNTNSIQQEQLSSTPNCLASNGKYVVVACADAIQCFSLPSLEPRGSLPIQNAQGVEFCAKNFITIVTANSSLVLRNIQTGTEAPSPPIANRRVKRCAVGENKTILAVGMEDGLVEILKVGSDGSTTRVGTVPLFERQDAICTYVAWWGYKALAVGYEYQDEDVCLYVIEFENTKTWTVSNTTDLGPVVSFLREENADVHQFWSCVLGYGHIIVVGASLATELGVVVKDPASKQWEVVDMVEPFSVPTFGDDFVHVMGLGHVGQDEFFMALTDGSIRRMKLETDVPAFQLTALVEMAEKEAGNSDEDDITPSIVDEDAPVESVLESKPAAAAPTPSIFGSTAPAFGSGGSGILSFGSGGSPSMSFASASAGIPSTGGTFGAGKSQGFSFGGLPPLGTNRFSMAKPLFGDAPKSTPPAEPKTEEISKPPEEPSVSFGGLPPFETSTLSMAKPLFGDAPKSTTLAEPKAEEISKPESKPPQGKIEPKEEESSKASVAFDTIDSARIGYLPIHRLEDLLDEVGEGLHGDEMDRQAAKLDPTASGRIYRSAFIRWYEDLTNDENDDKSIDSAEQAERAEDREKAKIVFSEVAGGKGWISKSEFTKVVETLGSSYTGRAAEYLAIEGKIREESFLEWYISWLFGDEDDDDEEEEEQAGNATLSAPSPVGGGIWSMRVAPNTWTCGQCALSNADAATKCLVCEALRPGYENDSVLSDQKTEVIETSKIGAGGFSFGGISSSAGDPTFPKSDNPTNSIASPGGFTFPESNTAETNNTGGFSFPSNKTGNPLGFVFQPSASETSSESALGSAAPTAIGFSFPPGSALKDDSPKKEDLEQAQDALHSRSVVAFDSLDTTKAGYLSMDRLEDLLDAVGEGLFGEERVIQASKMDPTSSGKITREAFLNWYKSLVSTDEDNESDEVGKAEERDKATRIFQEYCSEGEDSITMAAFPKVAKTLGIGNGSENHSKTIRRLAVDGRIQLSSFLKWYIDWMFKDEDSTDAEDNSDDDDDAIVLEENHRTFGSQSKSSSDIGPGGFSFGTATLSTGLDSGTTTSGGFSFSAPTNGKPVSANEGFRLVVPTITSVGKVGSTFSATASDVEKPTTGKQQSPLAFPPMSKTAPSPFGKKSNESPQLSSASTPAVAFPPVSRDAQKSMESPFSPFPPVSLTAPKSTGTKASPSPFPPISKAAPQPASSTTTTTDSGASPFPPMSLTAPKHSFEKPSASSPFPPMAPKPAKASFPPTAASAPKPLATHTTAFPPVPKNAPSAAFPSMAETAPKSDSTLPFTEKKIGFPLVPKTAPSAAFPPMAKAAPKAAGSVPLPEKKIGFPPIPKTASSPAFPPMAKAAPKAAGSVPLPEKKIGFPPIPKTASSPAFPPMAKAAPKAASALPPASAAVPNTTLSPTPFGSFGNKDEHESSALSFASVGNERAGAPKTSSHIPQVFDGNTHEDMTVSAVCEEYIALVRQMQASLLTSPLEHEDNGDIQSFVKDKATLICSTEVLESDLRVLKAKVAELLCTKSDTLRLVSESMILIENLRKGSTGPDCFESQPLDHRSTTRQRKLYNQAVACKSLVDLVGEKGKLFLQGESSEQRVKQSVVTSYNRSLCLAEKAKGRQKVSPVQLVKTSKQLPLSAKGRSTALDWERVEDGIDGLSKPRTKAFSLKNKQLPIPGHQLLPPEDSFPTPLATRKAPRALFSPPLQTMARPQWSEETTIDQDKFKAISLRPSSSIQDVTLEKGAKSAVLKYGTTIEKFQEASAITEEGSSYFARRLSPKKLLPVNSPAAKSPADGLPVLPEDNGNTSNPLGSSLSFGDLGSGLPSLAPKSAPSATLQSPNDAKNPSETISDDNPNHDYRMLLQQFYEKYNPSKTRNYDKILQTYKVGALWLRDCTFLTSCFTQGNEFELFSKLAKKYGAPNPLTASNNIAITPQGGNSPVPPFGFSDSGLQATNKSPFSNPGSGSIASNAAPSPSPFAGSGSQTMDKTPFSNTGSGPTASSPSPFVTLTSQPQTSQFGTPSAISVAAPPSQTKTFAGRTAREILTECFKRYNPGKLNTVDQVLQKYNEKEEEMIRNLARKYKFDVAEFGLQAAPPVTKTPTTPAFGQPHPLGVAAPTFGSPAPLGATAPVFGSPAPLGGGSTSNAPSTFGSPPQTTFGSNFVSAGATQGFGALASSPGPSFGSPTPFSTPFGAPRK